MTLLDILRKLRDQGPEDPGRGICGFIESNAMTSGDSEDDNYDDLIEEFEDLCRTWPDYSGHLNFPVPHSTEGAKAAYCLDLEDKWSTDTPYGLARWRLVCWCIAVLESR